MLNNMITRGKIDKAYMAGVIDSDGSISVIKSYVTRKTYRCPRFTLELTVTNTEPGMMSWIQQEFGGHLYERSPRDRATFINGRKITAKQNTWHWKIAAKKALVFLKEIAPYLKAKQKQAELAIEFQENRFERDMVTVKAGKGLSHYLSDKEIEKRTWYSETIQRLNKHLSPAETKRSDTLTRVKR